MFVYLFVSLVIYCWHSFNLRRLKYDKKLNSFKSLSHWSRIHRRKVSDQGSGNSTDDSSVVIFISSRSNDPDKKIIKLYYWSNLHKFIQWVSRNPSSENKQVDGSKIYYYYVSDLYIKNLTNHNLNINKYCYKKNFFTEGWKKRSVPDT